MHHTRTNPHVYSMAKFPHSLYSFSSQRGFTLIEIVIAIAIVIMLGSISLTSFRASRNVRDLSTSAQNVLETIRRAQSKTLAGENDSSWGVHIQSDRIILFEGINFSASTNTQNYPLPPSIHITNISLNGGNDIIFKRITGETDNIGTFILNVISSPEHSFSVTVDPSGKIYQSAPFPTSIITRTVDMRHRSFTLGWSIKTATTMTLTFFDPPSSPTVQNITMATFFDLNKTKFDWPGTFTVGGLDQVLRIHTTSLTASDTILSIDRDCRKNTKKLTIDIDSKTIATYEANCSIITIGAFGGTMLEP